MDVLFDGICSHAIQREDIYGHSAYVVETSAQNICSPFVLDACKLIRVMRLFVPAYQFVFGWEPFVGMSDEFFVIFGERDVCVVIPG